MIGTDLYRSVITFDHGDEDRRALVEDVWKGTPWMVDVYTDSINSARELEILEWCRDEFGPECWPIHGRPGAWRIGGATIHGWTWFGFDTEDKMNRFVERWPNPKEPEA